MYSSRVQQFTQKYLMSLFSSVGSFFVLIAVSFILILIMQADINLLAQEENNKTPNSISSPDLTIKPNQIESPLGLPEEINLLNGADNPLKYWKFYSADLQVKREETFYISANGDPKEPVLICKGKPFGYLRYHEECVNYDFNFEWKYAKDPNGNSGVLVHVNDEDKIWPKGMQIQLHRPTAGSIFPSGGAKSDNVLKVLEPPVSEAEWNTCEINSLDGKISVVINGKKQGEVTGCNPPAGSLALQSEGAEIHFRKLKLRKLPVARLLPNPAQPVINQPIDQNNKASDNTTLRWIRPDVNLQCNQQSSKSQQSAFQRVTNNEYEELDTRRKIRHAGFIRVERKELKKLIVAAE